MVIKWEPPSEEELAARGVGVALEKARAHLPDGKFKADDPDTPDVNEAWVKKVVRRKKKDA